MRLKLPNRGEFLLQEGRAYQGLARWEDSASAYKDSLALGYDTFWSHAGLAVDCIELGHDDAARAEPRRFSGLIPNSIRRRSFPRSARKARSSLSNCVGMPTCARPA